ncbi:hypothetical protein QBC41DRAFT_42759 [Cercophora samala]|uniref:Uncharacterized protein n=1 Tax=Cercophora samala TaxID=330535 RepID=A0AA39ZJR3_9PEZI|nr:hypothetical protein QBC41DRAFT_42759 [Cercophora samala]
MATVCAPPCPSQPSGPGRHEFGIGIFCALPLEATAVAALLDTTWPFTAYGKAHGDTNKYSTGSIGRHNVVLVHMPGMGKVAASTAATNLRRSFPNIDLALVVGICGGAPFPEGGRGPKQEQLLGDVVISSGVLQYDFGRKLADRFVPKAKRLDPGIEVRSALAKLETRQSRDLMQADVAKHLRGLQATLDSAAYPGRESDVLFKPDYLHKHHNHNACEGCANYKDRVCSRSVEMTCQQLGCSEDMAVRRLRPHDRKQPLIHIGPVASGDTVMRSGKDRDEIVEQHGVAAFEMEGAAVWDVFSNCLIIKGICDYADSHKNKLFQGYAAATAAAVTRSFLQDWDIYVSDQAKQVQTRMHIGGHVLAPEDWALLKHLEKSPYRDRKNRNPDIVQGTCQWFIHHRVFHEWDKRKSRALWVSADPGCGKSVLAKYLCEQVIPTTGERTTCYFFFKADFEDQKSMANALSCILHQLLRQDPSLFSFAIRNQLQVDPERFTKSFHDLWETLLSAAEAKKYGEIVCILDAIDECSDGRGQFAAEIRRLSRSGQYANLRFIITSRPIEAIRRDFQMRDGAGLSVIHLRGENEEEVAMISNEIDIFIKARIRGITSLFDLEDDERTFLQNKLLSVPHRTYLWVYLVLESIESVADLDKAGLIKLTTELPKSVDEAYENILSSSEEPEEASRILQIILGAWRPLTVQEMNFALSIREQHQSYEDVKLVPQARFERRLRDICGLLVTIVDSKVYLLHQTVREFLVKSADKPADNSNYGSTRRWKHTIEPAHDHLLLWKICYWHLLFPVFDGNLSPYDYDVQYSLEISADSHLFLSYSGRYFVAHLLMLQTTTDNSWVQSAVTLCQRAEIRYPLWYKAYRGQHRPTALTAAIGFGLLEPVKILLETGQHDINGKDHAGFKPLYYGAFPAARLRSSDRGLPMVELLLDYGATQIDVNKHNNCLLHLLIRSGYVTYALPCFDLIKLVLDRGANVNCTCKDGMSPVFLAQDGKLLNLLIERGADVNAKVKGGPDSGRSVLSYATEHAQSIQVLERLLAAGAFIDEKDDASRTPLLHAVIKRSTKPEVLQFLVQKGADVNATDANGRSVLSWAVSIPSVWGWDISQLLIRNGAVVDARDDFGRTPLSYSADVPRGMSTLELLVAEGADVNSVDNSGMSVLSQAMVRGLTDNVAALLRCGADVDARDEDSRTPLSRATQFRDFGLVNLFVNWGADVNAVDGSGRSILSWAQGHQALVEHLTDFGAHMNPKPLGYESQGSGSDVEDWIKRHAVNKGHQRRDTASIHPIPIPTRVFDHQNNSDTISSKDINMSESKVHQKMDQQVTRNINALKDDHIPHSPPSLDHNTPNSAVNEPLAWLTANVLSDDHRLYVEPYLESENNGDLHGHHEQSSKMKVSTNHSTRSEYVSLFATTFHNPGRKPSVSTNVKRPMIQHNRGRQGLQRTRSEDSCSDNDSLKVGPPSSESETASTDSLHSWSAPLKWRVDANKRGGQYGDETLGQDSDDQSIALRMGSQRGNEEGEADDENEERGTEDEGEYRHSRFEVEGYGDEHTEGANQNSE